MRRLNRSPVLMGLEIEYATACFGRGENEQPNARNKINVEIMRGIRSSVSTMHDRRDPPGFFMANGGNVYQDQGHHIEYATAECITPRDLVIWEKAGERILADACRRAWMRHPDLQPRLFKNNIDYHWKQEATYGCHENYLIPDELALTDLKDHLLPFLVTRQLYSGSGRIGIGTEGIQYQLSQRAPYFINEMGDNTTSSRALINTRDESLSDCRYQRLHLILGDSLMSQVGTFLKLGATALVLKMICDGQEFAPRVGVQNAVESFRRVSDGIWGEAKVKLKSGREIASLEIQRYYLTQAESFLQHTDAPEWAGEVVEKWRAVLQAVEDRDLTKLASMLDCYAKFQLHSQLMKSWGFQWDHLNRACRRQHMLANVNDQLRSPEIRLRRLCASVFPLQRVIRILDAGGNDDKAIAKLLLRMIELDVRYHDIDQQRGLYYKMRQQGIMRDSIAEDREIQDAMCVAPKGTRAHVRGRVIQHMRNAWDGIAWWSGIWDVKGSRRLDLEDPFCREERWQRKNDDACVDDYY